MTDRAKETSPLLERVRQLEQENSHLRLQLDLLHQRLNFALSVFSLKPKKDTFEPFVDICDSRGVIPNPR